MTSCSTVERIVLYSSFEYLTINALSSVFSTTCTCIHAPRYVRIGNPVPHHYGRTCIPLYVTVFLFIFYYSFLIENYYSSKDVTMLLYMVQRFPCMRYTGIYPFETPFTSSRTLSNCMLSK